MSQLDYSPAASQPSSDQILATLSRILGSQEFAESEQLSRLRRYVVENRLAGESGLLKESAIGATVFRRGAGYDPKADPIVRVEARRLRARLEAYYDHQGSTEPVRISLPKGGYSPIFEASAPFAVAVKVQSPKPARRVSTRILAAFSLAVVLAAGVIWRVAAPPRLASRFWSSLLDAERPALVVPADLGLVLLQDLVHQPAQLQDYVTGEYRTRLIGQSAAGVNVDLAAKLSTRRYTSMADLSFTVNLARRPEAARHGILTRFSRDVRVEDFKRGNLVLIGPRNSNPWVELFEKDATFRLEHDEEAATYRVINTRPGPGETSEILVPPVGARDEIYGIINYHRRREGSNYILMLAGTSVAGTEVAADFLLDDSKLQPWLQKALRSGEIQGFDMLLLARNLAGSAPRAEVIAFHVDP